MRKALHFISHILGFEKLSKYERDYLHDANIRSSIFLCLLLRTIDTFRLFDKVNILTQGGPVNSTTTITQYLYAFGIKTLNFGFGSAGALIMTIIVLILAIPYIRTAISSK